MLVGKTHGLISIGQNIPNFFCRVIISKLNMNGRDGGVAEQCDDLMIFIIPI